MSNEEFKDKLNSMKSKNASLRFENEEVIDKFLQFIVTKRTSKEKGAIIKDEARSMEECGELVQAISKHIRGEDPDSTAVLSEMADVYITVMLLKHFYEIPDEDFKYAIDIKLSRIMKREGIV